MALDTTRKLDLAIAAVATTAVTLLAAGAASALSPSSPTGLADKAPAQIQAQPI